MSANFAFILGAFIALLGVILLVCGFTLGQRYSRHIIVMMTPDGVVKLDTDSEDEIEINKANAADAAQEDEAWRNFA